MGRVGTLDLGGDTCRGMGAVGVGVGCGGVIDVAVVGAGGRVSPGIFAGGAAGRSSF
jgi:hypothetical protein